MTKDACLTIVLFFISFLLLLFRDPLSSNLAALVSSKTPQLATQEYDNFIKKQSGRYNYYLNEAIFLGKRIPIPEESPTVFNPSTILGQTTEEKWIEIDLSEQRLLAHEGPQIVYDFLVSAGKWAPTPQGEFRIWAKLRYSTMKGGNPADGTYYYLPNVPYTMYFYHGYGIHGTYWHNNFGRPMSHGCVNLAIPDAEKLFWWATPILGSGVNADYASRDNPGTKVVVHE